MAASDKELEAQLLESGNKLVDPPSSVDELLPLLDRVESCLSKVEQSPSDSMEKALSPSLKALVADKLLGHSDVDVKVAVASCISEITRITAPDAPYDDDQMKEVFQLIVSSFENLCDESSRSYAKRTSILETVAKVRSCVVMLDLECDALILEMFQHFLKAIRDFHPENVFSSMETIMTLVLEESEDISLELLTPILDSVKNDNEDVLPISRKLGERVLELCAVKVKPYLVQAVRDLGISLDDYSKVVATICEDADGDVEQNEVQASDENMAGESRSVKPSLDLEKRSQEDNAAANEAGSLEQVVISMDRSPQSALSNGITQNVGDDTLADSSSLKKQEDDQRIENSKDLDVSSNADPDNLDTEKAADTEQKLEEMTKKRGKKSSFFAKSTAPSESPHTDNEKEREELQDQEGQSEDLPRSPNEGPSAEAAVPSENDKGSDVKLTLPKALESESANVASVSPSEKLPEESRSKKSSRQKKKDNSDKEAAPSADNVSKKVADGTSDSEVKPNRRSGKKVPAAISNENKASTEVDVSKKESGTTSDTEAKPLRESAKKVDGGSKHEDGSSVKQTEDKKKRTRGKTLSEKDVTKSSAKDDIKDIISTPKSSGKSTKDGRKFEGTPKSNSKRKRTPGKEKESGDKDSDESLVGLRVRVWWPKDQMYYDGIIESFDPVKKKHKVVYTDGDQEILNLKRERFEFIDADSESDEEGETDRSSPDASNETPLKKKVKIKSDEPTKQRKVDPSPKKGGGASTSKSKGTTPKSGRGSKADGKSKDEFKSVGKSEDASGGKSKDHTPRTGGSKSANAASKSSSKSRNNDSQTSKATKSKDESSTPSTKSKQEIQKAGKSKLSTPKAATLSKDKTHHSGGKSSANGTGKMKSGSSKVKDVEDVKESSSDSKPHESSKGKSPNASKAKESEVKTGKKRRRGSKD